MGTAPLPSAGPDARQSECRSDSITSENDDTCTFDLFYKLIVQVLS